MDNKFLNSGLNRLIPPEIKNDEFYAAIQRIGREENIKTVLEIGSASGEGSTEAFVCGMRENPNKPKLFCMEVSKNRFNELEKRYAEYSFVKCYNVSSVAVERFPNADEVIRFYKNYHQGLKKYPLQQVLTWLEQDIDYIKQSGVEPEGIKKIKRENNIENFDLVLIDGSEFTGQAEMEEVYGAKYILLDDINTFKNYKNYYLLKNDDSYSLVAENQYLRNGYAIFKKTSEETVQLRQPRQILFAVGVGRLEANYKEFSSPRFREYANYHGFEYQGITQNNAGINRQPHWIKIHYVLKLINELQPGDLIAFLDADLSIVRGDIKLNTYKSVAFAQDSSGIINSGVWVVRVNEFSKRFFEAVWNRNDCDEHPWQDNLAVLKVIESLSPEDKETHIEILPNCLNVTLVKGEVPVYDINIKNPCLEPIRFRHFAGRQPWLGKYFSQSIDFNPPSLNELPIHFFTIVLNGEPFIRYHIEVLKQLPFKWHWHIVEGVADLKHDTSWSLRMGGKIPDELHQNGRSIDGTTAYLDELAKFYPEYVTVYRKPEGVFWDGKREMVNAPLVNIQEECLLWQVDVDEFWTSAQICRGRKIFIENPSRTAAFYWCWYFVGENRVISTRNCYGATPSIEWRRTWRYKPGYFWLRHEPPVLVEPLPDGEYNVVSDINPFGHDETEKQGLVFQHFSYVLEKQLRFKEQYYGFKDAIASWKLLQEENKLPTLLHQYFSWVREEDNALVDTAESCGIVTLAQKDESGSWRFLSSEEWQRKTLEIEKLAPRIIVDGVFFQLYNTGIARVWKALLTEWSETGFGRHILVLDRAGTAPRIPGIQYLTVPPYDYDKTDADREMLQLVCDVKGADLFISTYYTTPISTPSALMVHDMIPEAIAADLNKPMWREKHYSIRHASAYIAVSENTARDLVRFFPHIPLEAVTIAHNGVGKYFSTSNLEEIEQFKTRYGISKPYFILVGGRKGNKNAIFFFKAFSNFYSRQGFEIVCVGGDPQLEAEFRAYTSGNIVHVLQLSDLELRDAYSGAVALVYPSQYEGFGLPILEAMACGCPVIACPNASIPEVAGTAALYVRNDDVDGLVNALCEVQKLDVRNSLIAAGIAQAKKFSWSRMAKIVSLTLMEASLNQIEASLLGLKLNEINLIIFPDWSAPEECLFLDIANAIKAVVARDDKNIITLLIDTSNISDEDANLFLSSVTMDLLLQEELDVSEGPEISLIGNLRQSQWDALLRRVQMRISLEWENRLALAHTLADTLPACEIDKLGEIHFAPIEIPFPAAAEKPPVITMSSLGRNGRFANQIFQYAFLKIYAKQHNLQVETPEWIGQYLFGHNDLPISQKLPVASELNNDLLEWHIKNSKDPLTNVDFWGYFQYNTSFYAPHKEYFRSLFKPIPEIEAKMKQAVNLLRSRGKTVVGLHLRRGDFGYECFFIAPNEWYKEWLKDLWEILDEPILFIASDEPEKVLGDFAEYHPITVKDLGVELPQAEFYPDFYLLSQCDVVAISNSSFSFVTCMLNEKGKIFFRPNLQKQKLIPFDPWDSDPILRDAVVSEAETQKRSFENAG